MGYQRRQKVFGKETIVIRGNTKTSFLREYLDKKYGSLGNAAVFFGVKFGTLRLGCQSPKNGYLVAETLARENQELRESLEYQQDEYKRLARTYNALVDKIEQEQYSQRETI